MNKNKTKAILVVSFGTSYNDTRKKTIEAIEQDLADAYPDYQIRRAWTSKMIMAKLWKRDHLKIDNVKEAMAQMAEDGITDVIVQPTHVINGIENDLMKEDVLSFRNQFHSIHFGDPMLTTEADSQLVIDAIAEEFSFLPKKDVLVLMGHGTTHFANSVFVGTVEAYPSMETLLKLLREYQPETVHLAPFMIVAGDHATNDLAGDDPDSWRCQIERAGFQTACHLKGLGEYPSIRRLFLAHAKTAMEKDRKH